MDGTISRARRVDVAADDPAIAGEHYDYADAFEVTTPATDSRSPEEFARAALEQSPRAVRDLIWFVHRHVIRFALAPRSSPDHVFGWTIRTADSDVVVLEAESSLVRAVLVGRLRGGTTRTLNTYLFFRRPAAARVMLAVVGPLHRWAAAFLLEHAAHASTHDERSRLRPA